MVAATCEADGREVAIKTVDREDAVSCRRLLREADALRAIGPPYVPQLYATGQTPDGSPYLVLEKLIIPSLDKKLGDPMDRNQLMALANPILTAVEATHERGFVHRDLKPENIFVSGSLFTARLIDFGLTKLANATSDTPLEDTMIGTLLGTPVYMSPEQCEGRPDVDVRADIYALGVILYEMLTGQPPFFGKPAEVRDAHINRRPPQPSHVAPVSPAFDRVLVRCLAKEPERRYNDVGALRRALVTAMEQGSDVVRVPAPALRRTEMSSQPQIIGLIFFCSQGTSRVVDRLSSLGGQLIFVEAERHVAAFGLDTGGNPIERAFDGAQALIEQGLATCIVVDHERAKCHRSPNGARRVLTAAFRDRDRFPRPGDPSGVLVTERAIDGLGPLQTFPIEGRDGIRRALPHSLAAGGDSNGAEPLIGRAEQIAELLASAQWAVDDKQPTLATVIAEIGHGKSHLGKELITRLGETLAGAQIIELRAREPIGVPHGQLLQDLLRAVLRLPDRAPDDRGRAVLGEQLGSELAEEVWPAVALALGWVPAEASQVRKLSAAPSALRSAAAQGAGEALSRLAQHRPVLCVIDDAHYADETTLDALEYATLAENRVPLWVCVLADPIFDRARPVWANRAGRTLRIELTPLVEDIAAALCRRLLHPANNVPEQIIKRLVEWTGGNPLLLTELVGGVKRRGLIRRHARGESWYLATDELERLPELPQVEWLAERELGSMSTELASSARLVALLGSEFTVVEVEGVLRELEEDGLGEVFPLDAWVSVSRLLGQGLLILRQDGYFEFRHALIRDMVVRATPGDLRWQIHRAAFRYYRDVPARGSPAQLRQLAWHAEYCGLVGAAAATYIHLAERAQTRHEYLDAELMYSRAIELMPEDKSPARMRCYNGRGLMHYRLSRFADALADLAMARGMADHLGDVPAQVKLLLDQATVLDWMQDFGEARSLVHRAQVLSAHVDSDVVEARLCMAMGRVCFRSNELMEAKRLFQQAAARAECMGNEGYETLVVSLMLLGLIFSFGGQTEKATAMFSRAIVLCEERGDKLHLAAALNGRRNLWIAQKNAVHAAEDGLRAQRLGREIGQTQIEYATAVNLAELYYFAGDLDAAWTHIQRAVEIEPNSSSRPVAVLLHARLLCFAGKGAQAKQVLNQIVVEQKRARASGNNDALLTTSDQLLCEMVGLSVETAAPEKWDELLARARTTMGPIELIELIEFMSLSSLDRGDQETAKKLLGRAMIAAQQQSHLIEERIKARLNRLADRGAPSA
ncbi:MAG: protein kinase [Proteobacteria bacterium]|nr:protein kinase [Pseudomonadota bacterium]